MHAPPCPARRRRLLGCVLFCASLLMTAACTDVHPSVYADAEAAIDADGKDREQPVENGSTTSAPPPTTAAPLSVADSDESPEGAETGGSVTIAFGGDVHFEQFLGRALAAEPHSVLDTVAEMMAGADLAIVNLETAVTDRGTPSHKEFNFRTTPQAFDALRAAGIDVVSMANNHGMDYGLEGLDDSLDSADAAGFAVIGIGRDAAEAYAPFSTEINGQRIAVIGATQVIDGSLVTAWAAGEEKPGLASAKEVEPLANAVAAADAEHDLVVVFLHWGIEGHSCPSSRQMQLSDTLVDAGADIVVGTHAHHLQGGGYKDDAFIHYGLGNFVFYTQVGGAADSGVLLLTVDDGSVSSYEWVPARLDRGVATRLPNDRIADGIEAWESLRSCTDLR